MEGSCHSPPRSETSSLRLPHRYVKLLALPLNTSLQYLPPSKITLDKDNSDKLQALTGYIENTCINRNTWPPANWSLFGQNVRTNNDVEGWHQKLNSETRPSTGMYQFALILHRKAASLPLTMRLFLEGKICCHQSADARTMQAKLNAQWDRYRTGDITAFKLLRVCAGIYGPTL